MNNTNIKMFDSFYFEKWYDSSFSNSIICLIASFVHKSICVIILQAFVNLRAPYEVTQHRPYVIIVNTCRQLFQFFKFAAVVNTIIFQTVVSFVKWCVHILSVRMLGTLATAFAPTHVKLLNSTLSANFTDLKLR